MKLSDIALINPSTNTERLSDEDLVSFIPMAAVTDEGQGMEAQKARALRRQLFRDADPGWPSVSPAALFSVTLMPCCEKFRTCVPLAAIAPSVTFWAMPAEFVSVSVSVAAA